MSSVFISGIGTRIGKTLVSAIIAEALEFDYWKPVQAGFENGTDSDWVRQHLSNSKSIVHREHYKLKLAASPHIASREEGISIDVNNICDNIPNDGRNLVIEGAGGLLVPLNEKQFVTDLIQALGAKVILVSRNYLGSINHSLLSARLCKQNNISVVGWIFTDHYMNYEDEIVGWSGLPRIASIPYSSNIDETFIANQAAAIRDQLATFLC